MKKVIKIKKIHLRKKIKFRFKLTGMGGLGRLFTKVALWMYFNPVLQILVVLAILVGFNYLGNNFYTLLDLTQYRSHTINKETVKMISKLDQDIEFNLFLSENTPQEIGSIKREIIEYFDKIKRFNPSKVKVNIIDPTNDAEARSNALDYQITEYQYGTAGNNAITLGKYYLSVGVKSDTTKVKLLGLDGQLDQSLLPSINKQLISYLERGILEHMRSLNTEIKPQIGLVALNDKVTGNPLATEFANLSKNVKFSDVNLETQKDLSQFVGLWIISPNVDLSNKALIQLDQYILRGGRVVFLAEGYQVDSQSLSPATLIKSNVMDLLLSYGVEFSKGLVMDTNYATQYKYPYIFNVSSDNFSNHELLNGLQSLRLSWVTAYKKNLQNYTDGKQPVVTSLFHTSQNAGLFEGDTIPINVEQQFTFPNRGTQDLAFLVEGYLKSYFTETKGKERQTLLKDYQKLAGAKATLQNSGDNAKIVVVGASLFGGIDIKLIPSLIYWSVNDNVMLQAFKSNSNTIIFKSGLKDQTVVQYKRLSYLVPFFVLITIGGSAYLFNRQK